MDCIFSKLFSIFWKHVMVFLFLSCYRSTCLDCTLSHDCGFCYEKPAGSNDKLAANSTCLPTYKGFGKHSIFGPCETNSKTKNIFVYEHCPTYQSITVLSIFGMYFVFFCYGIGLSFIPWLVCSEIFPQWGRSTCVGITCGINWIFCFLVTISFIATSDAMYGQGKRNVFFQH